MRHGLWVRSSLEIAALANTQARNSEVIETRWRIGGGIDVLARAAVLAHHVLTMDLASGPGIHLRTSVDVHHGMVSSRSITCDTKLNPSVTMCLRTASTRTETSRGLRSQAPLF